MYEHVAKSTGFLWYLETWCKKRYGEDSNMINPRKSILFITFRHMCPQYHSSYYYNDEVLWNNSWKYYRKWKKEKYQLSQKRKILEVFT